MVIDADDSARPFADGPIDPFCLVSWPDLLGTPSDENRHILTEILVYICTEVLVQNAALVMKQEEDWRIFDDEGELRSRTVEERIEKIDLDGNAIDNRGEHVISKVLHNDTSDFVHAAIEHGANLRHVDNSGNSLVCDAVKAGAKDCFAILLEAGAPIDTANNEGRTPLHIAAENNRLPMAKTLLDASASKDACDNEGKRAADLAEGAQMRTLLA